MSEWGGGRFERLELLIGSENVELLRGKRVAVFGLGGVGSFAAEALVRSGIGTIDIVDDDVVSLSNINRQLLALTSTVGQPKTEVMKRRLIDINPGCIVNEHRCFFLPGTEGEFDFPQYDYVVDAIDTVAGKIALVMASEKAGTPVICSMAAGNSLDPSAFRVSDIYKTSVCPLARVMRRELKKRGIKKLKVVYSKEEPIKPQEDTKMLVPEGSSRRSIPGSAAFVPPVAGFMMAGEVIKDLTGKRGD